MIYLVALIAIAICLIGLVGLAAPALVVERVRGLTIDRRFRELAILVRFVVGGILMLTAFDTRFPLTMLVVGGLVVVAGVALIFIDEARLNAIVQWALGFPPAILRVGFACAFLFGAFLIYAIGA